MIDMIDIVQNHIIIYIYRLDGDIQQNHDFRGYSKVCNGYQWCHSGGAVVCIDRILVRGKSFYTESD